MWDKIIGTLLLFSLFDYSASTPTLVPRILQEGYQLEPYDNQYFLSITLPDGTVREETVEEIEPGQLQVKGMLNEPFNEQNAYLVVTYEAGPNGYVAKYSYGKGKPTPPTSPALSLSPNALKSAAG